MRDFFCNLRFHAVGQGLFSSGKHYWSNGSFCWVYDCGTSSSREILKKRIDEYVCGNDGKRINLLAISHFDKDHVNGLAALLEKCSVGTLLLPYVPLHIRLAMAFSQKIDAADRLMQFYVDPVSFIEQIDTRVQRILVVPHREDGGSENAEQSQYDESVGWFDFTYPKGSKALLKDFSGLSVKGSFEVDVLRVKGAIKVGNLEFVPYNDSEKNAFVDGIFKEQVYQLQGELFSRDASRVKSALDALSVVYSNTFGGKGYDKNVISLFLYVHAPSMSDFSFSARTFPHPLRSYQRVYFRDWSVLYTGDGYLESPVRLKKLRDYMGEGMGEHVCVLQVMHHGSSANWYKGLSSDLSPRVSVFCADPSNKNFKHPHADVMRDFLNYNPFCVDKNTSFEVSFWTLW